MLTGPLPPASIHGTWSENLEIWSTEDDTLMDLSAVTEITLSLRDPALMFPDMTLTKSKGQITIPSQGIVQWRAEAGQMGTLAVKTYDVVMTIQSEGDTIPLIQGSISIVG